MAISKGVMENIIDAHYFVLPSQGNVYSLTKLCMSKGGNKILAASLRRKVFSFEYSGDSDGFLNPTVKEVLFTYIPNGTEIISIDAFTRSQSSDDFVIGITIIKSSEHNTETYLNIYSEWEPSSEINLDSVAQNCLMIELDFIPYQLYHTEMYTSAEDESSKEVAWLLSGSDEKIHMFREDRENHCYSEVDVAEHFPELVEPPSIILWMDIHHCMAGARRISAFGCECGYVKLAVVDVTKKVVVSCWSARFEGPISTVRLFTEKSNLKPPSFLDVPQQEREEMSVHLLVTNTLQASVVYMNVLQQGLHEPFILPDSEHYDAVLCSATADVDMDGRNEVVLGTYGQEVLIYKYQECSPDKSGAWLLVSQRSFANPIHSILYLDVTGDGVREFVILTLRGVHILQHDPKDVSEVFNRRYKKLTDLLTTRES
ncbi:Kaptin [Cryptotermes secundus]|uniref:Kaptin n=1 Tax=Cryptotermes secundus TaxID=105785 RepID=A0A2J7QAZ5_9NEOP|nr:KICSTOR complex protein kaptin isoform X2 [Cryptotermes secundus]XP_023715352.1 KICSTOR complex protein kaptin isoform X2 [Cryptotermes secundus]XP_023715353.1 KICSTOR complex protein kaptin isoform X2 [Cryptotermes secundus]XP_023715354.1 KICSTOR complex protein kaptin isoform X2 [Cryptotermes secundus]PNF25744.1 Kaptin [Cryptotermes secundus]PNF25746.1 Kaptin [Cryptotermes secundus]